MAKNLRAGAGSDAAGSIAERTVDLFSLGKIELYQPVTIEDAIASTHKAASDLDLQFKKEEKHPDQLKLIYTDDRKRDITIILVRRTAMATEIHTDVGLFGVEGMGRLVMRRILNELPGGTLEDKRDFK